LFWSKTRERKVFGPDILQEAEKQAPVVRENLRIALSRQKSHANHRRRELSFEVGGYVYLKVSPMRSLSRFKVRRKLAPRFTTFYVQPNLARISFKLPKYIVSYYSDIVAATMTLGVSQPCLLTKFSFRDFEVVEALTKIANNYTNPLYGKMKSGW
jgi:hypothetical protein